ALTNLLDIALKFTPDGGVVEVAAAESESGEIRISVRDHGLGIAPEHRTRIFNRFYQAHDASHRSGLGLGLYVARQAVQLHGGWLDAEFPSDGGTRFVMRLPADRLVAGQEMDDGGASPILVVDDDDVIRSLISTALTDEGYQVLE